MSHLFSDPALPCHVYIAKNKNKMRFITTTCIMSNCDTSSTHNDMFTGLLHQIPPRAPKMIPICDLQMMRMAKVVSFVGRLFWEETAFRWARPFLFPSSSFCSALIRLSNCTHIILNVWCIYIYNYIWLIFMVHVGKYTIH